MKEFACVKCEHIGKPKLIKKGSTAMEVFIWATVFVFGPFYSFWRWKDRKKVCEKCEGDVLVSLDSRVGSIIAEKYSGIFDEEIKKNEEFEEMLENTFVEDKTEEEPVENESKKLQEEVRKQELEKRKNNSKIDNNDKEDW